MSTRHASGKWTPHQKQNFRETLSISRRHGFRLSVPLSLVHLETCPIYFVFETVAVNEIVYAYFDDVVSEFGSAKGNVGPEK